MCSLALLYNTYYFGRRPISQFNEYCVLSNLIKNAIGEEVLVPSMDNDHGHHQDEINFGDNDYHQIKMGFRW